MIATPAMLHARAIVITFAGAALVALGGCATAAAPAQPEPVMANPSRSTEDCMFSVVVRDWTGLDKQRFIFYGLTQHEAYLGKVLFPTPDLVNNLGIALVDIDHNGRICGQSADAIEFRDATIPGRNPITSLQKISEEQARALVEEARKSGASKYGRPTK